MQKEKKETACRHDNHALARSILARHERLAKSRGNVGCKILVTLGAETARRPAPLIPSSSLARPTWDVARLLSFHDYHLAVT